MSNTFLKSMAAIVFLWLMFVLLAFPSYAQVPACEKTESVVEFLLEQDMMFSDVIAQVTDPEEVKLIKKYLVDVGKIGKVEDATWFSADIFTPADNVQKDKLFVVLYDIQGCAIRGFWDDEKSVLNYLEAALGRRT